MAINFKILYDGLNKLRGLDFEQAEAQTRTGSNANLVVPIISFVKEFQARLAALALEVPYADIAELPLKQYNRVCNEVQNFLNSNLDDETASENSEALLLTSSKEAGDQLTSG